MKPDSCSRYRISRPNGYNLAAVLNGEWSYRHGVVRTPHGFVLVYADNSTTQLSIIVGDFEVRHTYRRYMSNRYIVTLARRFAESAAQGDGGTTA